MAVIACDIYRLVCKKNAALAAMKSLALLKGFELIEPVVQAKGVVATSEPKITKLKDEIAKIEKVIAYLSVNQKNKSNITNKKIELTLADYEEISDKVHALYSDLESTGINEKLSIEPSAKPLETRPKVSLPHELLTSELIYQNLLLVDNDRLDYITQELETVRPISLDVIKQNKDHATVLLLSILSEKEFVDNFVLQNKEGIEVLESSLMQSNDEDTLVSEVEDLVEVKITTDLKIEQVEILYDLLKLELLAYEKMVFLGEYYGEDYEKKQNELVEITGWVDPDALAQLKKLQKTLGESAELKRIPVEHRKDIRTKMKNNRVFKPFELITEFMGVPGSDELDPSPLMAVFVVLFFGFALGDAGYGLILLIGSLFYLLKKKPVGALKEGLKLMIYCSISTIIFGALTGGWFGVDLDTVGGVFGETLRSMKQIDLQASIILVLGLSLAAGFIQQIFGFILEMVTYFKRKDYWGGILGSGTWLLLLLGTPILIASSYVEQLAFLEPYKTPLLIIILALFAYGQGRKNKNIFLRPIIGLGSLFNLTGLLSNTLSYARLLALGLATGVIASVINLIAGIMGNTDSVIGIIIFALILIVGHLFNLALNVLGTFVNIVRLQLVEFFPRFFNAEGTALEPLNYEPKYLTVPENINKFGALFVNISNLFITN